MKPHAKDGIFLKYLDRVKGYRIWSKDLKNYNIIRDMKFNEDEMVDSKYSEEKNVEGLMTG